MLEDVVGLLRCPHGEPELRLDDGTLSCAAGHRFDVARQGYANLLVGRAPAGVDTATMVAARVDVLSAGHQDPLTAALAEAAVATPQGVRGPIVDLGAGTGHHLAGLLDAIPATAGLAIDLSKHAARRAARAHPRIGAVVADVWAALPVRDGVAQLVVNVFAPRNPDEMRRILADDGRLVVVTPAEGHLAPLIERLGLLRVAAGKHDDLDDQLAATFAPEDRTTARWSVALDHREVAAVVAMGPSSWHTDVDVLARTIEELPGPVEVELAVTVSVYRPAS